MMTHEDAGHYAAKHPEGCRHDQLIETEIGKRVADGTISCASAFAVCKSLNVSPKEVGCNIDLMELRLVTCQLGLFGYGDGASRSIVKTADHVDDDLAESIHSALVNNRLPCAAAWRIAGEFKVKRMDISAACNTLNIKIKPCQLGAF